MNFPLQQARRQAVRAARRCSVSKQSDCMYEENINPNICREILSLPGTDSFHCTYTPAAAGIGCRVQHTSWHEHRAHCIQWNRCLLRQIHLPAMCQRTAYACVVQSWNAESFCELNGMPGVVVLCRPRFGIDNWHIHVHLPHSFILRFFSHLVHATQRHTHTSYHDSIPAPLGCSYVHSFLFSGRYLTFVSYR